MNNKLDKRGSDVLKGITRRNKAVSRLNIYLIGSGLIYEELHKGRKIQNPAERAKNNVIRNYVTKSAGEKAMGLFYELRYELSNETIPFVIMFKTGGYYFKIPTAWVPDNGKKYWEFLHEFNVHILMINEKRQAYSRPISVKELREAGLKWWMGNPETGNKNRINLSGNFLSSISTNKLGVRSFDGELKDQLKKLFK